MRRSILLLALVGALVVAFAAPAFARGQGNPNPQTTVFVTSQNLTYDSIVVVTELPFNGTSNWQLLEMGDDGLETEFGPGDVGYFGGRWWVDENTNGEMDADDRFFLCPLLGPGY
jgi:hypothetical protein